jgi:hypothetical protein
MGYLQKGGGRLERTNQGQLPGQRLHSPCLQEQLLTKVDSYPISLPTLRPLRPVLDSGNQVSRSQYSLALRLVSYILPPFRQSCYISQARLDTTRNAPYAPPSAPQTPTSQSPHLRFSRSRLSLTLNLLSGHLSLVFGCSHRRGLQPVFRLGALRLMSRWWKRVWYPRP